MIYEMKFDSNAAGVGSFSCVPAEEMSMQQALDYLKSHPNDQFMHNYLLFTVAEYTENEIEGLIEQNKEDLGFLAVAYEASVLCEFRDVRKKLEKMGARKLAGHTPLIFTRWALDRNSSAHLFWTDVFARNVYNHEPLPSLKEIEFPIPFDLDDIDAHRKGVVHIRDLCSEPNRGSVRPGIPLRDKTASETVEHIVKKLTDIGLLTGTERRTVRSLSPYALERSWNTEVRVALGRNRWRLTAHQTSYGKGMEEDQARASYLMEMVERFSSFAGFTNDTTIGYKNEFKLIRSNYTDLTAQGICALDPNAMNLEIPYEDQVLYWIVGHEICAQGSSAIYVPAQFVFLFCNLDEPALTSGVSSNGIASGNTKDEARLHALMEYIERDAERVALYSQERSFLLEAEDPSVAHILDRCREKGRYVQFLDLTPDLGIPCYKAFVQTEQGEIAKGCAAGLTGKAAAVSALTELAYPFFGKSRPPAPDLKTMKYEELPDYSSGDVSRDLNTLERLLLSNGLKPIYVDLTRKDLDVPVARAFVPGLEFMPILDRFSGFSKRQFRNYLKIVRPVRSGRTESSPRRAEYTSEGYKLRFSTAFSKIGNRDETACFPGLFL
jgi:ribosomal protein S12 methylthiotransferase accessory factor YcaO